MKPDTTTLYLRNMPVRVVRNAKAAAARRGCTLAHLVTIALERVEAEAEARPPTVESASTDDLDDAIAWYERHRSQLERRYRGEYLAIIDRSVVDHGRDFEALASRVFEAHGPRPVYMPRVGADERRATVRTPRRVPA